jgi:hypothetical protein
MNTQRTFPMVALLRCAGDDTLETLVMKLNLHLVKNSLLEKLLAACRLGSTRRNPSIARSL